MTTGYFSVLNYAYYFCTANLRNCQAKKFRPRGRTAKSMLLAYRKVRLMIPWVGTSRSLADPVKSLLPSHFTYLESYTLTAGIVFSSQDPKSHAHQGFGTWKQDKIGYVFDC